MLVFFCDSHHSAYLLFGPELIKHLLDLNTPVVLHAVEGVLGHGGHHRLLDGRQLLQDAGEGGTHVGVLVPALWTNTVQCVDTLTQSPGYICIVLAMFSFGSWPLQKSLHTNKLITAALLWQN